MIALQWQMKWILILQLLNICIMFASQNTRANICGHFGATFAKNHSSSAKHM